MHFIIVRSRQRLKQTGFGFFFYPFWQLLNGVLSFCPLSFIFLPMARNKQKPGSYCGLLRFCVLYYGPTVCRGWNGQAHAFREVKICELKLQIVNTDNWGQNSKCGAWTPACPLPCLFVPWWYYNCSMCFCPWPVQCFRGMSWSAWAAMLHVQHCIQGSLSKIVIYIWAIYGTSWKKVWFNYWAIFWTIVGIRSLATTAQSH